MNFAKQDDGRVLVDAWGRDWSISRAAILATDHIRPDWPNWILRVTVDNGYAEYRIVSEGACFGGQMAYNCRLIEGWTWSDGRKVRVEGG